MASMALTTTLSKFQSSRAFIIRGGPGAGWSSRLFVGVAPPTPKPFQGVSCRKLLGTTAIHEEADNAARQGSKAAKQGTEAAKKAGQELKHDTLSNADDMMQKSKNVAGKVADASKDMTDKAKQTAQGAWESVKDTTQKIKDTVTGKAEDTKDFVKRTADTAQRNINNDSPKN